MTRDGVLGEGIVQRKKIEIIFPKKLVLVDPVEDGEPVPSAIENVTERDGNLVIEKVES